MESNNPRNMTLRELMNLADGKLILNVRKGGGKVFKDNHQNHQGHTIFVHIQDISTFLHLVFQKKFLNPCVGICLIYSCYEILLMECIKFTSL